MLKFSFSCDFMLTLKLTWKAQNGTIYWPNSKVGYTAQVNCMTFYSPQRPVIKKPTPFLGINYTSKFCNLVAAFTTKIVIIYWFNMKGWYLNLRKKSLYYCVLSIYTKFLFQLYVRSRVFKQIWINSNIYFNFYEIKQSLKIKMSYKN